MDITKGYKTSEFYLSILAFLAGVFLASGVLPETHWAVRLAGAVLAGLGSLGYSVGRGLAKGAAKALLPLALVGALLSGCCSTGACYLDRAHVALTAADAVALDAIGKSCLAKAEACGTAGSANCPAWIACDESRKKYVAAITAIDSSLAVVNRLLADLGVGGK